MSAHKSLFVKFCVSALSLLILLGASGSLATEPTIATASNFKSTMELLLKRHQSQQSNISTIYSSSGKLLAQIQNGAPIDLFLSAEPISEKLPANFIVADSEFTYAYGRLALISRTNAITLDPSSVLDLSCLAIANPKLAPYGRAADSAIKEMLQLGWRIEKVVKGQSVAQAFQFFDSGACDYALVAHGQVLASPKKITHLLIPKSWHAPIRQNAILLKRGKNNPEALKFFEFLKSDTARKIIRDAGYLTDIE